MLLKIMQSEWLMQRLHQGSMEHTDGSKAAESLCIELCKSMMMHKFNIHGLSINQKVEPLQTMIGL